ncbi:MAG: Lrp/AsnC ligand binding domain-containing protein [Nitrososphaerales archaeon]|nr:Lrp/AsnC ligand binding domain-containing protein [Nitrososphaerales archaeon]
MERAIVLVNLSPGADERSAALLRGTPGVSAVYQLYGLYDLLVIVEGRDEQAVKAVISDKLRTSPDVISTITMKVVS